MKAHQGGFPEPGHDHDHCVVDALAAAAARCTANGSRLTDIRREVLAVVWASHRPVGAYDILAELGRDGRRIAPPTVYRALDFLLEQGLVHRVASQNAFIGCPSPGHVPGVELLICTECGSAIEVQEGRIAAAVSAAAARHGFEIGQQTIEVLGRCAACRKAAA
jgi:Fur family zinc uptake transcriptional regulator